MNENCIEDFFTKFAVGSNYFYSNESGLLITLEKNLERNRRIGELIGTMLGKDNLTPAELIDIGKLLDELRTNNKEIAQKEDLNNIKSKLVSLVVSLESILNEVSIVEDVEVKQGNGFYLNEDAFQKLVETITEIIVVHDKKHTLKELSRLEKILLNLIDILILLKQKHIFNVIYVIKTDIVKRLDEKIERAKEVLNPLSLLIEEDFFIEIIKYAKKGLKQLLERKELENKEKIRINLKNFSPDGLESIAELTDALLTYGISFDEKK